MLTRAIQRFLRPWHEKSQGDICQTCSGPRVMGEPEQCGKRGRRPSDRRHCWLAQIDSLSKLRYDRRGLAQNLVVIR